MYGEPIKLQKHISFDENLTLKSRTNQKTYNLSAVIAHQGGENFGHYITCRKVIDKWYVISDNMVKESTLQTISGAQAYMLIYDWDLAFKFIFNHVTNSLRLEPYASSTSYSLCFEGCSTSVSFHSPCWRPCWKGSHALDEKVDWTHF